MKVKSGTIEKVKFSVLKNLLNIPRFQVIGLLEGLWYLTALNAPDGAIGRFTDLEIASWLEWSDSPDTLIQAFLTAGFIDPCEHYRLLIHDWPEHCPMYIRGNLAKHKKDFAKQVTKQCAKQTANENTREPAKQADDNMLPSLVKSNQDKSVKSDDFDRFWNCYPKKVAKEAARKAWKKISQPLHDVILADITARKLNGWQDKKFIPNAATYLNGRRWEDEHDLAPNVDYAGTAL